MAGDPRTHDKGSAIAGIVIGLLIATSGLGSGWAGLLETHVNCLTGARLGNVTAWDAPFFVASPYLGLVSGSLVVWNNFSWGRTSVTETNFTVASGNVTARYIGPFNWTILADENVTERGPGAARACSSPMVALVSRPAIAGGTTWVGLGRDLKSDVSLPTGFNSTQLCLTLSYPFNNSACATSATFSIDFQTAVGEVDTCGSTQPQVVPVVVQAAASEVPFTWEGRNYSVPADFTRTFDMPGAGGNPGIIGIGTGGAEAWYNYTFPASGGIWAYDYVRGSPAAYAGLVFSYSICP